EVVNTNPLSVDALTFAVYITYTSDISHNLPRPGIGTVNMSFAPTPPVFAAFDGAAASSSLSIPRFSQDPNAAANLFQVDACISQSDPTPPSLLALAFSAASVDVSTAAQSVIITATASDDLSGVSFVEIGFTSPSNQFVVNGFNRISGSNLNGVYQA